MFVKLLDKNAIKFVKCISKSQIVNLPNINVKNYETGILQNDDFDGIYIFNSPTYTINNPGFIIELNYIRIKEGENCFLGEKIRNKI